MEINSASCKVTNFLKLSTFINFSDKKDFVIKHYAGPVTYTVHGFLDKNNNDLYRNLKELMLKSQNSIVKSIYSSRELKETKKAETVSYR